MIPDFYDGMFLPDGDHSATWQEVQDRFGQTGSRRTLCNQLSQFILTARGCGFVALYVFGSFISGKTDPGDVDLIWVYRDGQLENMGPECRDLIDYSKMKARFAWDMFCCSDAPGVEGYLLEAFRENKAKTKRRGIIRIDLQAPEGLIL
jgi:hypothetical protein